MMRYVQSTMMTALLALVWFSERDIRLIVRIFDFKEYIFNFEDQSLKDF